MRTCGDHLKTRAAQIANGSAVRDPDTAHLVERIAFVNPFHGSTPCEFPTEPACPEMAEWEIRSWPELEA